MKILTIQGTPEQLKNLMQCISGFDKDRLPKISKKTTSEKHLKGFLKFKQKGGFKIWLSLCGQGDSSISTAPINLCTVTIGENKYYFGGISEPFYDKMVKQFHDEE